MGSKHGRLSKHDGSDLFRYSYHLQSTLEAHEDLMAVQSEADAAVDGEDSAESVDSGVQLGCLLTSAADSRRGEDVRIWYADFDGVRYYFVGASEEEVVARAKEAV